jgi:hypothetical protein
MTKYLGIGNGKGCLLVRENMRANKKFTIIKLPVKRTPEVKHPSCKVHKGVRMVDVGKMFYAVLCAAQT